MRIFNVEFNYVGFCNSKREGIFKDNVNIVAKDVMDACQKVKIKEVDNYFHEFDDEDGHNTASRTKFDPINVTLEAEAD